MTLKFGTDGVRGEANRELTPELAMSIGRSAARVLGGERIVIGRDTRISGPLLESALAAGFAAEGVNVERLGVLPTPGVAWVAQAEGIPGAMISASHNAFGDNGIKLFAAGGRKLPHEVENAIERGMGLAGVPVGGDLVGTIVDRPDEVAAYTRHLSESLGERRLDGLRVVLDCANGAASAVAPEVFERVGANVVVINDRPDGCNINDRCGATQPEVLRLDVVDAAADLGLAFDGDADRLIAVDHTGAVVDGDHILAILATDMHQQRRLHLGTVVVTVMSNLGFRLAMEAQGIRVVQTAVGDRYVLEALGEGSYTLGGEQSGHVIFPERATTGDGILTGLVLLDAVVRSGRPLGELADAAMTRLPQVLVNVRVAREAGDVLTAIAPAVAVAEAQLGATGRVLVRTSGTEPLVRVMVEAAAHDEAERVAKDLVAAVERAAGV